MSRTEVEQTLVEQFGQKIRPVVEFGHDQVAALKQVAEHREARLTNQQWPVQYTDGGKLIGRGRKLAHLADLNSNRGIRVQGPHRIEDADVTDAAIRLEHGPAHGEGAGRRAPGAPDILHRCRAGE